MVRSGLGGAGEVVNVDDVVLLMRLLVLVGWEDGLGGSKLVVGDWIIFNLSGVKSGDVGMVVSLDEAMLWELGDRMGDSMERVVARNADVAGLDAGRVEILVLPNPPCPRDVSDMMVVVCISG